MSDISNGDAGSSANNNDPESNQNKKDSEKKRREQENICIEELAMLISAQLPEYSDSDDSSGANDPSKLEKGSILQETVEKLKKLKEGSQAHAKEIQREEISSSQSVLPKEILGSLVLEALDGFMFIVSNDGKIDFVSDNVFDYLGFKQDNITEQVIYNFIHHGDHARFSINLEPDSWRTWKRLPQNAAGRQGFDRSKVFNVRFLLNNVAKQESMEDHQQRVEQYENMQVSAIVMLNPIEDKGEDPKSGLFCIARRITHNERSGLTPVEQFTTKSSRQTFKIETVDTEGLPELYRKNISGHALGKTLVDLVHPHDKPLIKEHIEGFCRNIIDTSRVYRMVLPPPQNVVHVKTKTKDFRPQPGSNHPGYIMSTHAIIRENELQLEDLPALRPELRGIENDELPRQIPHQISLDGMKNPRVTSPQVQNTLIQRSPDIIQTESTGRVILSTNSGRGFAPPPKMTSPHPVSSPNPVMSPYSSDMKSDVFHQLLSPSAQSENMNSRPAYSPQGMQKMPVQQSPSNGGNELLKELLKPKENESKSRDSDGPCYKSPSQRQSSSQGETVTLLQLLNEKNNTDQKEPLETSELLKQLRRPPETLGRISELAQLLQNSPVSSLHPELKRSSSNDEGPAAKQVPSLEKLLSVRPDRTIPPPVPRKWSEIPQEKLPRDIVIDRLNRNNNATQVRSPNARSPGSYTSSTPPSPKTTTTNIQHMGSQPSRVIRTHSNTSRASNNSSSDINKLNVHETLMPHFNDISDATQDFQDLLKDPLLSKILDSVVGLGDDNDNNSDQNLAEQKIHEIAQSLKSGEHSFAATHSQPSLTMVQTTTNSSRVMVSSGGVISHGQQQYSGPGVIRPGVPRILQQRPSGNPVTFQPTGPRSPSIQGTNMEELLKGIPPNVAIKTIADQQSGSGMRSALERQLSSPTPARHLSGDTNLQNNVANFSRSGRHASGDQIQVLGPPSRRSSGDSSIQRYSMQPGGGGHPSHGDQHQVQGSYTIMPEISQQSIIRTSAGNTIMTSQNIRQGRAVGNLRRGGPGGRALSQEDLEAFGLSVEVSNDFRSPSQASQYANKPSPQFSPAGNSTMNPFSATVQHVGQFNPGGGQPNKQFSPVGSQPSGQFVTTGGKPNNQFSPVGANPGAQFNPIVSQGSQFGSSQLQQVVHISQAETQFTPPGGLQSTQFSPVGGHNGPQVSQFSPINNQQVSPFSPQFSPSNPSSHFSSKPGAYNSGAQPGRQGM